MHHKHKYWNKLTREQKQEILKSGYEFKYRQKQRKKFDAEYRSSAPVVLSTRTIQEPTFKEQYHFYLNSAHWKRERDRIIKYHSRCAICNTNTDLQVHHISYEHVFKNHLSTLYTDDFVIVCKYHHQLFHDTYGVKKVMRKEWRKFYVKNKLP